MNLKEKISRLSNRTTRKAVVGDLVLVDGEAFDVWEVTIIRPHAAFVERIQDGYPGGWEDDRKVHVLSSALRQEYLRSLREGLITQLSRIEKLLKP